MPKKNNPGCNCCGCDIFSDDYTRADSDDPGSYTEVSGDWDIVSNQLDTASSSGALVATSTNPDGTSNIRVDVDVTISTSGNQARIILDYTDSNNYWYAQVTAGTGATLKIYQRSGGVDTQMQTKNITRATGTFSFCASIEGEALLTTRVGNFFLAYEASFSQPSFGLGTGTAATTHVKFDNLVAVQVETPDCPPCGGQCVACFESGTSTYSDSNIYWADVTFSDAACSGLNGLYRLVRDISSTCCWFFTTAGGIRFGLVFKSFPPRKACFSLDDTTLADTVSYSHFIKTITTCSYTSGSPLNITHSDYSPTTSAGCYDGNEVDLCNIGTTGTLSVDIWSG